MLEISRGGGVTPSYKLSGQNILHKFSGTLSKLNQPLDQKT